MHRAIPKEEVDAQRVAARKGVGIGYVRVIGEMGTAVADDKGRRSFISRRIGLWFLFF